MGRQAWGAQPQCVSFWLPPHPPKGFSGAFLTPGRTLEWPIKGVSHRVTALWPLSVLFQPPVPGEDLVSQVS